jgi:GMP synthase-like glutamine amidotransferase
MRAHYLQHVQFEGLGSIEAWLKASGYAITRTRFFADDELPDIDSVDLLVVMGGPMSVHDREAFPWLAREEQFVRSCIESGKAVLGVCLGAQLIASAMAARVYANHKKEIGWFPVHGVAPSGPSVFQFPASVNAFHWHGETFDLPDGAVQLAKSRGCENQAFQLGRRVIGLQFHLETTPESARNIVSHCRAELADAGYVQSEAEIIAAPLERYAAINKLMGELLAFLTGS